MIKFYIMALFKGGKWKTSGKEKENSVDNFQRDTDGWSKTQRFEESNLIHTYVCITHIYTYIQIPQLGSESFKLWWQNSQHSTQLSCFHIVLGTHQNCSSLTGHVFPACLGEKSYICSKHFAFSSLLPIWILVSSSGAWLCNNMSSINSSYIKPVGINLRCQQAFACVALSPILLFCSNTKSPLECSPCQVGWVAKVATQIT